MKKICVYNEINILSPGLNGNVDDWVKENIKLGQKVAWKKEGWTRMLKS